MNWHEYYFNLIKVIAEKSKDETKVGCIIVGPNYEPRSFGFNGFPRGVKDKVEDFLALGPYHLKQDQIEEAKVSCAVRYVRPTKYLYTEHAERNAIYNAARVGTPLEGCHIYLDYFPCADCARAIIQSGISEIILDGRDFESKEKKWKERWKESCDIAMIMLREAGVNVVAYQMSNDGKVVFKVI